MARDSRPVDKRCCFYVQLMRMHLYFATDKWTIFNDRKVAVSEEPPFELGYIYLYESTGPA